MKAAEAVEPIGRGRVGSRWGILYNRNYVVTINQCVCPSLFAACGIHSLGLVCLNGSVSPGKVARPESLKGAPQRVTD